MKKPSKESQIETIMSTFDFARVATMMKRMGWAWQEGRPDEMMLRKQARDLFEHIDGDTWSSGSGGLVAYRRKGWYGLAFEVTSTWGYDE